jgi:hypothetical protein
MRQYKCENINAFQEKEERKNRNIEERKETNKRKDEHSKNVDIAFILETKQIH